MNVFSITEDPFTRMPTVILTDDDGTLRVAIRVGLREAAAIAAELRGIELERPATHQLTCRLLEAAGARIERIEIVDGARGSYSAHIVVVGQDGREVSQPARCSDAIAIALHAEVRPWVARRVVDAHALPEQSDLVYQPGPAPRWRM